MKERLKTWWGRRPRMTRGGKTALNLGLCALFLLWVWGMLGYPLPTARMEFRRLERESLMPRSEILWRYDGYSTIFVGRTGDCWTAGYLGPGSRGTDYMESGPLGDGPSPVPLTTLLEEQDEEGQPVTGNAMLFLQVPDEAARAVVRVTGRGDVAMVQHGGVGRTETFEGELQDNGVVYVWMGWPLDNYGRPGAIYSQGVAGMPYTLELYRADGSLLLEQAGTIPEP